MNPAPVNSAPPEVQPPHATWAAGSNSGQGWSSTCWFVIITFIFAVHVALIFLSGEKKAVVPRAVTNVPTLQLANETDELLALNDPTLFALPGPKDFAVAGAFRLPDVKPPLFRWTESPRWLPLSTAGLGTALGQFMQTNYPASPSFNFKPVPLLSSPALPAEPLLVENSTLRLEGELVQRQLPLENNLTNWPYANVIAPSVVQLLVDAAGNVISAVLLPPGGGFGSADQYPPADQQALELARTMHFAPATRPTVGRLIFNWHTVPPAAAP